MGITRAVVCAAAGLTAVAGLAGCASSTDTASSTDAASSAAESSTGSPASSDDAGCPITATDTWAKAADSGMTAVFGRLTNNGKDQVTIDSGTSPAAGKVEIHEMVDQGGSMVMQPKAGGLVLAPGAAATLAPGAEHIMLMDLTGPILAGDTVEVTLQCGNGTTAQIEAAARTFTGAEEQYQGSGSPMASRAASDMASPAAS